MYQELHQSFIVKTITPNVPISIYCKKESDDWWININMLILTHY